MSLQEEYIDKQVVIRNFLSTRSVPRLEHSNSLNTRTINV